MKASKLVGAAAFFVVSFGLTLAVLAATDTARPAPAELPATAATAPEIIESAAYSQAAEAFRKRDFAALERLLGDEAPPGSSLEARVLHGLYAQAAGQHDLAVDLLRNSDGYRGELEDWRLWSLAASAAQSQQPEIASAALATLITAHSASPLAGRAVVRLAELGAADGEWQVVLEASALTDRRSLGAADREALVLLTWNAAEALGDNQLQMDVARQLLVHHPLEAAELEVVERLRQPDGSVEWATLLSRDEILARAERLVAVGLPESALETLEVVDEDDRSLDWALASAVALTAAHRGEEALEVLGRFDAAGDDVRREWTMARAALEAASPRRGRHLSAEERAGLRERALAHLQRTADLSPEPVLSQRALRLLFSEFLSSERFEDSLAALARLQEIDPADTTGARPLWNHGWSQYVHRNYSGAIGYWAELAELYPKSNYNRAGLYWSGRAHERLGNRERAAALYRQVSSVDFTDIYCRYALQRLGLAPQDNSPAELPTEPWPTDPRLARAERLHRLALEELALLELETVGDVDKRSHHALRARILAASGDRRSSIISLRSTFPLLGTPHQNLVPVEARQMFYPLDFAAEVEKYSSVQQVSHHLVFGMIRQESAFDVSATSWAGARGLMQIMPSTARELAGRMGLPYSTERLSDPDFSIQLGTRYFRQVLDIFEGDEVLALAGYNAGPYRIKRLWRQAGKDRELDHFVEHLALDETKSYVKRVLLYSDSYRRLYASAS